MSPFRPKRIVLNSHRFFRDVSPEVLKELALEDDNDDPPGEHGDPELYDVIRQGGHQIILTEGLRGEYNRESKKEGFPAILIAPVIEQLKEHDLIIEPHLPGGSNNFPGIPSRHKVFPNTAINAGADYLITERRLWLSRADRITNDYGVMVVTPSRFIQREGR